MTSQELIKIAIQTINPLSFSQSGGSGGVACALITEQGDIFTGVCIDTRCSMGFCAEHNAIGSMLTKGQSHIRSIVAVRKKNETYQFLAPCGRCREFMYQINNNNIKTKVILNNDKIVILEELLPYYNREQNI